MNWNLQYDNLPEMHGLMGKRICGYVHAYTVYYHVVFLCFQVNS